MSQEQPQTTTDDLVGRLVQISRETKITEDCTCAATKRLDHSDHSPRCAYHHPRLGAQGVVWKVHNRWIIDGGPEQLRGKVLEEGQLLPDGVVQDDLTPFCELEMTDGSGWELEPSRDEVTTLSEDPIAYPAHVFARLEMIERAATELIMRRKILVKRLADSADDDGRADFDDESVVRAGQRAEEAIDTLARVLDEPQPPSHTMS